MPTLSSAASGSMEFLPIGPPERRSLYRTPIGRRRDVLAFADLVISDAHRLYARRAAGDV